MESSGSPAKVIPLTVVDRASPPQDGGETMRAAVVQVITDLFIGRVPAGERSVFYDAAKDILVQAGCTPEELVDAAEPGPQQDALFQALGFAREADG